MSILSSYQKEEDLCYESLADESYQGVDFTALRMERLTCSRIVFEGCTLIGASFLQVDFSECDFSHIDFTGSHFIKCTFTSCKGLGMRASECVWKDSLVTDCNFSYSDFTADEIRKTTFRQTDFSDTALVELKGNGSFLSCNLSFSSIQRTRLADFTLHGSTFDSLYCSEDYREFRGSELDVDQALSLSLLLGIKLRS